MLIAGDIGGTNTRLALFSDPGGVRTPAHRREFPSEKFPGLAEIIRTYLSEVGQSPTTACFDVAGPVSGGRARLTNLPWLIDEAVLARDLGLRQVSLINDLQAVAYAIPRLEENELRVINQGRPAPHGALAVLAPGTGLGEAFLVWSECGYVACASEGGHADFAAVDSLQAALREHLAEKFGHVSYEHVCAGSAIPRMYEFLRAREPARERAAFAAKLAAAEDKAPPIVEAALEATEKNPLARATLDLYVSIVGAEAGNLALKILSTGGLYLAGGMPPRILSHLLDGRFMRAFTAKGRFAELLAAIPVKVVLAEAGLLGAALYGFDRIGKTQR
ncbi:MAG: glucokinase [Acetobacteraceae bacterium]